MLAPHVLALLAALTPVSGTSLNCRVFPGDDQWPTTKDWNTLNKTVSGRLVATVPIAAQCHYPNYNQEACKYVQDNWHKPPLHDVSSSSIMAPVWTNRSCDPFNGPNTPCTLGNYVRYAINVSTPADITAGLRFVKKHGIRLVVRNTGHDYIGKSTGAGALGIWTRHLKRIEYIGSYTSRASSWTGAAFKLGAGVQGFEAHEAAHARGVTVVAGECPTVGIAGGYSQGGGHSALASRYGLAADQVLEWEVVTADGKLLIANAVKNKDLYWALAGGGGGTYGVVVSMTVKAHPDEVTTTAKLSWTHDGSKKQVEAWWEAIDFFHQQTPSYTDHGVMILAICTGGFFSLGPFFGSGLTAAQTETMLAPVIAKLKQLELPYNLNITQYSGYLRAFNENFAYVEVGIAQYGGRLIPRKTVLEKRTEFQAAIRKIVEDGALVFEITTHPTLEIAGNPYNAVLPAWRDNELDLVIASPWNDTAPWSSVVAAQKKITNKWDKALRDLTPGSGVYMNEADAFEPDFKKEFFGPNYVRLLSIKDRYDPDQLFYAVTAVGSDRWENRADGRLCKTQTKG